VLPLCEQDDGILPDGTCPLGYPNVLPENVFVIELWEQITLLGWEAAMSLNHIELSDYDRGTLVKKLKILAVETRKAKKE